MKFSFCLALLCFSLSSAEAVDLSAKVADLSHEILIYKGLDNSASIFLLEDNPDTPDAIGYSPSKYNDKTTYYRILDKTDGLYCTFYYYSYKDENNQTVKTASLAEWQAVESSEDDLSYVPSSLNDWLVTMPLKITIGGGPRLLWTNKYLGFAQKISEDFDGDELGDLDHSTGYEKLVGIGGPLKISSTLTFNGVPTKLIGSYDYAGMFRNSNSEELFPASQSFYKSKSKITLTLDSTMTKLVNLQSLGTGTDDLPFAGLPLSKASLDNGVQAVRNALVKLGYTIEYPVLFESN